MQLPIDIKALFNEATSIKDARETPISVSVYIDEDAPQDMVAHVRNAFASSLPTVRMTITYLGENFIAQPTDDIAVIVAGVSEKIGRYASDLRAVGVPVMVVTSLPETVEMLSKEEGHPIPDGDLIYPSAAKSEDEALAAGDAPKEPIVLTEENAGELDEKMGRWIVTVCRDKRLAYAVAFPFVRRPLARDAVQQTSVQNAGVGLVAILPGADLPIMTLNQAKMVLQISAAYGQEMNKSRLKELAAVVGNAYVCRTLTRELVKLVPVLGFIARTGVAYGGTAALGNAVIEYFEGGQNVAGVANVVDSAISAGTKVASKVRSTLGKYTTALDKSASK